MKPHEKTIYHFLIAIQLLLSIAKCQNHHERWQLVDDSSDINNSNNNDLIQFNYTVSESAKIGSVLRPFQWRPFAISLGTNLTKNYCRRRFEAEQVCKVGSLDGEDVATFFAVRTHCLSNRLLISLIKTGDLNYEWRRFYKLSVTCDGGDGLVEANVLVNVLDENDNQPAFRQTSYQAIISDHQELMTPIEGATVIASDADTGLGGTLAYFLVSDMERLFAMNSLTGELLLTRKLSEIQRYTLPVVARDRTKPYWPAVNKANVEVIVRHENSAGPQIRFSPVPTPIHWPDVGYSTPVRLGQVVISDEDTPDGPLSLRFDNDFGIFHLEQSRHGFYTLFAHPLPKGKCFQIEGFIFQNINCLH